MYFLVTIIEKLLFIVILVPSVLSINALTTDFTKSFGSIKPFEKPVLTSPYTENGGIEESVAGIPFKANSSNILTYDTPLLLTPYLESGKIVDARILSSVGPLTDAPYVPSYSGFFTVNKEYNSNLFFWFFPALNRDSNAPVILWLQGGPGATGLVGLFVEHGPYIVYSNSTVGLREHTWNKEFHVIYVDSPVGTGFSYTGDEKGYATNVDQVAEDLYCFLEQFFKVYHEYAHSELYVSGESYAGKYVPYLGYKIHVTGAPAETKFKGISIGNGFFSLDTQYGYSDYLFKLGVVDLKQAVVVKGIYDLTVKYQQNGEKLLAIKEYNKLGGYYKDPELSSESYLTEVSGYENYFNLLHTKKPDDVKYYRKYIKTPKNRNAIHVGNLTFHKKNTVQHYMKYDILTSSSKDKIAFLIDNDYKVLLYSGQLDLRFPHIFTGNLLRNLTWKYSDEYKTTNRGIWKLDKRDYVAGYVRSIGKFHEVLVRNAGHMPPHDQPEASLDLITKFIKNSLS